MLHVPEALEGRHGVVLDAGEVGRVAILDIEVGGATERKGGAARKIFVDVGDLFRDVSKSLVEELKALVFYRGESVLGCLRCFAGIFKVFLCGLEAGFYAIQTFDSADVGIELFEVGSEISYLFLELFFNVVFIRLLELLA